MKRSCTNKVGVTLQYPIARWDREPGADAAVIARARKAVPRLTRHPDTGAGPFCKTGATGAKCAPKRDIEFDFWGGNCGLTSAEATKLARAFRGTDVRVRKRAIRCCGSEPA